MDPTGKRERETNPLTTASRPCFPLVNGLKRVFVLSVLLTVLSASIEFQLKHKPSQRRLGLSFLKVDNAIHGINRYTVDKCKQTTLSTG